MIRLAKLRRRALIRSRLAALAARAGTCMLLIATLSGFGRVDAWAQTSDGTGEATAAMASARNVLAGQASPYLRMHGEDPIHWQVWGEAALARAQREQKLIFVSVGYFSCHWCHVMHRESFKDTGVAGLLNESFVTVKVDRELNPALDAQLLEFVQATRGRAGWPLNVFLTPEGYPLLGTTYVPRDGFAALVKRMRGYWDDDPERLRGVAKGASQMLAEHRAQGAVTVLSDEAKRSVVEAFRSQVMQAADTLAGGFGDQNKFPSVPQLTTLLYLVAEHEDPEEREFLLLTLRRMERLGLRDQVGGGFFRYVTDPDWQTPHFEKMLYDNAQLIELYAHASQVFPAPDGPRFAAIALNTAEFLLREMAESDGGFIASLSAVDNEGREGEPYWVDADELAAWLSPDELKVARLAWGLDRPPPPGSGEGGHLIMGRRDPAQVARALELPLDEVRTRLRSARAKVLAARGERSIPRDDKRLAGWNGLALSALVKAASVGGGDRHAAAARALRDYLVGQLWDGKQVVRMRADGKASGVAGLRDYVYLARGLLDHGDLAGADEDRLLAFKLLRQARKRFHGEDGWRLSQSSLLASAPAYELMADGAVPSATAMWATSVLRAAASLGGASKADASVQGLEELVIAARAMQSTDLPELRDAAFFHATQVRLLLSQY